MFECDVSDSSISDSDGMRTWWLLWDAREEIRPGNGQEGDLKMSGRENLEAIV